MIVHCALWLSGGQWRELSGPGSLACGFVKADGASAGITRRAEFLRE